jgi:hypothetical protein
MFMQFESRRVRFSIFTKRTYQVIGERFVEPHIRLAFFGKNPAIPSLVLQNAQPRVKTSKDFQSVG